MNVDNKEIVPYNQIGDIQDFIENVEVSHKQGKVFPLSVLLKKKRFENLNNNDWFSVYAYHEKYPTIIKMI